MILSCFLIQCTSNETAYDEALLEDEIGGLVAEPELGEFDEGLEGGEFDDDLGEEDDLEDLADIEDGDLEDLDEDEVGEDEELAALDEDLEGEEFDEEDEDGEDEDDDDAFFGEKGSGAEDEFAELEDGESDGDSSFTEDEKSLAQEMGDQAKGYPVTSDAQPQFPEEVLAQKGSAQSTPSQTPPLSSTVPIITSETQKVPATGPSLPRDDLGIADPILPPDESVLPDATQWVPVVKIKTDPFFRNQRLMNSVYIVRPGDSMESISQKLFEDDRVKELREDNPHLAKGIDPGDKVYYNSPNRSEDRTALKLYYDDLGLPPQSYTTSKNENMRRLGLKLLGFAEGWKEVWAINPNVDSKTILPEGTELKYWTGQESKPTPPLMANNEVMEEEMPPEPPVTPDPPVKMEELGGAEEPSTGLSSPLPQEGLAGAQTPGLEPAPPGLETDIAPDIQPFPEEQIAPPSSSPEPAVVQPTATNDSLLTVGAMALMVMAGVGLVAIQVKKRKDQTMINPASLEYTQA